MSALVFHGGAILFDKSGKLGSRCCPCVARGGCACGVSGFGTVALREHNSKITPIFAATAKLKATARLQFGKHELEVSLSQTVKLVEPSLVQNCHGEMVLQDPLTGEQLGSYGDGHVWLEISGDAAQYDEIETPFGVCSVSASGMYAPGTRVQLLPRPNQYDSIDRFALNALRVSAGANWLYPEASFEATASLAFSGACLYPGGSSEKSMQPGTMYAQAGANSTGELDFVSSPDWDQYEASGHEASVSGTALCRRPTPRRR